MKIDGAIVMAVYVLAMGACAWAAFRCGAWVIGTLAIVGVAMAVWGALKLAGAWANPTPSDGEGE